MYIAMALKMMTMIV